MRSFLLSTAAAFALPFATAMADDGKPIDISKVNGAVVAEAGRVYGSLSTVNGAVRVQAGAEVAEASTVNGSITVEAGARVGALNTVNGAIRLGAEVQVEGDVETVNGSIVAEPGGRVTGALRNVNGAMTLEGVEVGALGTVNGSLNLVRNVHVAGPLTVRKPSGLRWFGWGSRTPARVTIGPGSRVDGPLTFEHDVDLYVHDSAEIGEIVGAEARRFSGDTP